MLDVFLFLVLESHNTFMTFSIIVEDEFFILIYYNINKDKLKLEQSNLTKVCIRVII